MSLVIPAQAGIQFFSRSLRQHWIPACAGMTFFISGCALWQPAQMPPPQSWAKRQAELASIVNFTLRGRISSNAATVPSASLFWRQIGPAFDAQVSGPFGAGAVSISGTPEDVELRNSQETVRTPQPEAWLRERVGWSLPIRGLRYWIIGLPAPGTYENLVWDERERIAVLTQSGWTLKFEQYRLVEQWELPRLLVMERGDLRVKFVIDEWLDLPTSTPPASL